MLHLTLEHFLLFSKSRCSRSRLSIPLMWKTIDRSHFSRSYLKTIERAASKQVTEFLSRNNLLDPNESGFKSGHSTKTALLSVTEVLKTAKAAAQSSVLILLDLSAAFDSQPTHPSVYTVKYGHFWQGALLV